MKHLLHLQPFVPHYREEFFRLLAHRLNKGAVGGVSIEQTIYTYECTRNVKSASFNMGNIVCRHVRNWLIKSRLLIYNPLPFLRKDVDTLVLMLHFAHITTWLLLLTKWIHHKRIILWGQGISVRRYLKEERKPDWRLKCMISLADGVWLYMDKEKEQWQRIFPEKPMVALHNTLTGVGEMVSYKPDIPVGELKIKHSIRQEIVLIFCARFTADRRVDLLLETIKRLDANKYAFVIIGAGASKPDFSAFSNVYDFGAIYDTTVKRELFALSDIYFQPGWLGLSIVEAMAYGKPIFTFRRNDKTLQCVEYAYVHDGENGKIFDTIDECVNNIQSLTREDINIMGQNARRYVAENLTVEQMVQQAMSLLNSL